MTTCDQIRERLTAYLDGELADDRGSVVRGHLRECAACRDIARDEAALRDGLRHLPSVDPPSTMWAGIQSQLAAAEVADAKQPRWRLAIARWKGALRAQSSRLAIGGLAVATAACLLYWKTHRDDEQMRLVDVPLPKLLPSVQGNPAPPAPIVTPDLTSDPDQTTASYASAIDDLMKTANEARARWTDAQRVAFDDRVKTMRDGIAHAKQAKLRQRAQRSLIRYLQGAVVRDEVAVR